MRTTILPILVSCLTLAACDVPEDDAELGDDAELDVELEPELDPLEGTIALDPSERDELELLAPDEDAQTVSCDLGLPTQVLAGPSGSATAKGHIYGIASALYFLDAVRPNFPWLLNWTIKAGTTTVAGLNQPSTFFFASDGTPIDVIMQLPAGAVPGVSYNLQVRLYTASSQLACTDQVSVQLANCGSVGWWWQNNWPTPGYDGANCLVAYVPGGSQPFVWSNNWYVKATNGNQCSVGTFDGANCYVGSAPAGHSAFIWGSAFYFSY